MGLRMILTGLWMTPLDLEEEIKNKAIQMGIFSNVLIFKTNEIISGLSVNEFAKLWNFEKSKEEIYKYIEDAEKYLVQPDKKNFETKKMIFRYALILENQPKLPIELFPKDWPQFRASLIYKKVRRSLPV